MERKGQAAMEFLMTYGWAILAAIIAIGVLAYFGVFSPGKFITGAAVVNPPFYANAWNIQAAHDDLTGNPSGITLELRNNGGEDYSVSAITVDGTDPSVDCTWTGPVSVPASESATFNIDCSPGVLTEGSTYKGDLTITYTKGDSLVVLTSTGTIAEKITA